MLSCSCRATRESSSLITLLLFVLFRFFRRSFCLRLVVFSTFWTFSLYTPHLVSYDVHVLRVLWAGVFLCPVNSILLLSRVGLSTRTWLGCQDIDRKHRRFYLLLLLKLSHCWVSCLSTAFENRGRARVSLTDDQRSVTCYLKWRFLLLQIWLVNAVFCFHNE